MHITDWIVCGLFAFGALTVGSDVGKPRPPITVRRATLVALVQVTLVVALLASHGVGQ